MDLSLPVAQGFTQVKGEDYDLTWSPTVWYNTLHTLLAITAVEDLKVHQVNVVRAYLTTDLEEEVFMELPEGFKPNPDDKGKMCQLRKALYRLKQLGRMWNKLLIAFLSSLGFRQSATDTGIMVKGGLTTRGIVIPVYIDNILIISQNLHEVEKIKKQLVD